MEKITKILTAASGALAITAGSAWADICTGTAPGATCVPVPEINASAGFAAVAVLVTVALIVREMFVRRRSA